MFLAVCRLGIGKHICFIARRNKKDGYRQQNVRQRQKCRGLKICSIEAFYPYAKLIFGRRQFCVYTKDRKLLSQQKKAVYQHTCINAVEIFVRIFGLLI